MDRPFQDLLAAIDDCQTRQQIVNLWKVLGTTALILSERQESLARRRLAARSLEITPIEPQNPGRYWGTDPGVHGKACQRTTDAPIVLQAAAAVDDDQDHEDRHQHPEHRADVVPATQQDDQHDEEQ